MPKTLVLHTTEGSTIASARAAMDRNRSWSNWVCDPATGALVTLQASERGDRSLRNLSGGVETNNRPGVWQLEIVGRAALVPGYDDDWYYHLAAIVRQLCDTHGIPRRFPAPFVSYPRSYGVKAAQRMTGAEWLRCDGIVGHQHVPENDHGDPGDISRLIPLVVDQPPAPIEPPQPPTTEEARMGIYSQAMEDIDALYLAYEGEVEPGTPEHAQRVKNLRIWGRDLAKTVLVDGKDPAPTVRFVALHLAAQAGL